MVQLGVSLEALVEEAWSERWPEIEWSIHLNHTLAKDNSDLHNLCRYLLKQATLSEVPNTLMFNYLSYTVATQVVSHSSLLAAIMEYRNFKRTQCIECILDVLNLVRDKMKCNSNESFECEKLCRVLHGTVGWLLDVLEATLKINEGAAEGQSMFAGQHYSVYQRLVVSLVAALVKWSTNTFISLGVYFHQLERSDEHKELMKKAKALVENINSKDWVNNSCKPEYLHFVRKLESISDMFKYGEGGKIGQSSDVNPAGAHPSILYLATIYGSVRLTHSSQKVGKRLTVCCDALSLPWWLVLRDFIRGALVLQLDPGPHCPDSGVCAFVYLKVPRVIQYLVNKDLVERHQVLQAVEAVAAFHTLLNSLDMKVRSDCFYHLLQELRKLDLVMESELGKLNDIRNRDKISFSQQSPSNQAQGLNLVLKAEPTFQTLIKSFNSDFALKQDKLVQMMYHMITGKSFEYICAAAAAINRLHHFTHKVVQFNETSERGNDNRGGQRSDLFDLSFLLLSRISLFYDVSSFTKIVDDEDEEDSDSPLDKRTNPNQSFNNNPSQQPSSNNNINPPPSNNGFFLSWSAVYGSQGILLINTNPVAKPPQYSAEQIDEAVEALKMGRPYWNESSDWSSVCWKIPHIGQALTNQLENHIINQEDFVGILDTLQGEVCSLIVMLASWLLHSPPTPIRHQMATTLNLFLDGQHSGAEKKQHFDRWSFMGGTVRKLLSPLLEPPSILHPTYPYLIAAGRRQLPKINALQVPTAEHIRQTFIYALKNGWASASILEILYRSSKMGKDKVWTTVWMEEVFMLTSVEEMSVGCEVGLGLGIGCGPNALLSLAVQTLQFVVAPGHEIFAVAPRGPILAKFILQCFQLAMAAAGLTGSKDLEERRSVGGHTTADDGDQPKSKIAKLDIDLNKNNINKTSKSNEGGDPFEDGPFDPSSHSTAHPPSVIKWVFCRFLNVCRDGQVKSTTYFIASFLHHLAKHSHPTAKQIIRLLPLSLIPFDSAQLPFGSGKFHRLRGIFHSIRGDVGADFI